MSRAHDYAPTRSSFHSAFMIKPRNLFIARFAYSKSFSGINVYMSRLDHLFYRSMTAYIKQEQHHAHIYKGMHYRTHKLHRTHGHLKTTTINS